MIAAIDVGKLLELVWAAALAGDADDHEREGHADGDARAEDCRRNRRSGSATAYAALSVVSAIAFLAIAVFGIVVITAK